MRWLCVFLLFAVAARAEVSLLSEDDSCDVCVIVTRAILKSFKEHQSSSNLETGFNLDPAGNLARKKSIKYMKSETRFIEVMESVCSKMDDYRTNYWDPTIPKFVKRDKDVMSEDGETRTEFLSTQEMSGNSPAEMMLAIKRQIMSQFGDQIDDNVELKVACDHLLEDWEDVLEVWYHADQPEELDHLLCVQQFRSRLNYSCCIEEYPETLPACDLREGRFAEIRRKLNEAPKADPLVEDAELPAGQMRDSKGVIWQVGDQDKNPFADWAPPQLAQNQIVDERGVVWQVDPESDAMRDYKKRIGRQRLENERKSKEWEEARAHKKEDDALRAEGKPVPDRTVPEPTPAPVDPAPAADAKKKDGDGKKAKKPKAKPPARPIPPAVAAWLDQLALGEYAQAFANSGYDDLAVIAELVNEDLEAIGVDLPGHRKKILIAARKLAPVAS